MPFIVEKKVALSRMAFQALVRYDHDGQVFYGNLVRRSRSGYVVERLGGNIDEGFVNTNMRDTVTKVRTRRWHDSVLRFVVGESDR